MSHYTDLDYIHEPEDHPLWQESFVLVFGDQDSDTGGFLRVGHYVNEGRGQCHFGIFNRDNGLRFRRHRLDVSIGSDDRQMGQVTAGPLTYRIVNDEYVQMVGDDGEAALDLRLYDFFPSQDWRVADPDGEAIAKKIGAMNHPEASGRIEGWVRLGDKTIEIKNGLGHRDHAWGPREAKEMLNNRWVAGTVGPELSFSCATVQLATGDYFKAAWIVRNGKVEYAQDINTAAIVLPDGVSTIGGWTEITLDSEEKLIVKVDTLDGIITSSHLPNGGPGSTPAGVEAISRAHCGGLSGICDFNINVNPLCGEKAVSKLILANHDQGLTRFDYQAVDWAYKARQNN